MAKRYLLGPGSAIFGLPLFSISPLKAETYADETAFAHQIGEEILASKAATMGDRCTDRDADRDTDRLKIRAH